MKLSKLTKEKKSEMYLKHLRVADALAHKFHKAFGVNFNDLLDHAQSILGRVVADWENQGKPDAGYQPITWIYRKIYYALLTFCTRQKKMMPFSGLEFEEQIHWEEVQNHRTIQGTQTHWAECLLAEVGEDARLLISVIIDSPMDFLNDISPKGLRHLYSKAKESLNALDLWNTLQHRTERIMHKVQEDEEGRFAGSAAVAVRRYLVREGWNKDRIKNAWEEVRECL